MRSVAAVLSSCLFVTLFGCAKGGTLIGEGGSSSDGGASSSDGGTTQSGPSNNNVTSGPTTTDTTTSGPTTTNTTTSGPSTTTSNNTTATTGPSTVTSTSSGMSGDCDPENPALDCGTAMHCVPQPAPPTTCEPAGAGGPYALCVTRSECGDVYECVNDGLDACCMKWCRLDGLGTGCNLSETCTALGTPLFADGAEYGVCWDGFPCVL